MTNKFNEMKQTLINKKALAVTGLTTALVTVSALPVYASVDITSELTSSFQATADVMIATIFATLPVVMSVMSAYLCIKFGFNFFKRFAK